MLIDIGDILVTGLRLLAADRAEAVMQQVDELLRDGMLNPFKYAYRNIRILSGEEEGVFAWLAVNYLNRYFDLPHPGNVTRATYGMKFCLCCTRKIELINIYKR